MLIEFLAKDGIRKLEIQGFDSLESLCINDDVVFNMVGEAISSSLRTVENVAIRKGWLDR